MVPPVNICRLKYFHSLPPHLMRRSGQQKLSPSLSDTHLEVPAIHMSLFRLLWIIPPTPCQSRSDCINNISTSNTPSHLKHAACHITRRRAPQVVRFRQLLQWCPSQIMKRRIRLLLAVALSLPLMEIELSLNNLSMTCSCLILIQRLRTASLRMG